METCKCFSSVTSIATVLLNAFLYRRNVCHGIVTLVKPNSPLIRANVILSQTADCICSQISDNVRDKVLAAFVRTMSIKLRELSKFTSQTVDCLSLRFSYESSNRTSTDTISVVCSSIKRFSFCIFSRNRIPSTFDRKHCAGLLDPNSNGRIENKSIELVQSSSF